MNTNQKITISRSQWDKLNKALSCGYVAVTETRMAQYHPEWVAAVEAARDLLCFNCEIQEGI